MVIKSSRIRL